MKKCSKYLKLRNQNFYLNRFNVKVVESYGGTSSLVKSGGTDADTKEAIGFLWIARNISSISPDLAISSLLLQSER